MYSVIVNTSLLFSCWLMQSKIRNCSLLYTEVKTLILLIHFFYPKYMCILCFATNKSNIETRHKEISKKFKYKALGEIASNLQIWSNEWWITKNSAKYHNIYRSLTGIKCSKCFAVQSFSGIEYAVWSEIVLQLHTY